MNEEEIKGKLLDMYRDVLRKYRVAAAGRACPSSRDFLHGKVTQSRETIVKLYGDKAPEMLRSVEGD